MLTLEVEIDLSLKKIYTILHSDGNDNTIPFLNIDAIDLAKRIETAVNVHLDAMKKEHEQSTATNPNIPKASNPIIVTPISVVGAT